MKTFPLLLAALAIPLPLASRAAPDPDFGPNVLIFDPATPKALLQEKCDAIFQKQYRNQFGAERYALLFKPGVYQADLKVGFYTQVAGLGRSPADVTLDGPLHTLSFEQNNNVTLNFWRSAENFTVNPGKKPVTWAVSQAAPMRRMHIMGELRLFVSGWASGGYLADSKIDGQVVPGSQQQWFSRNSSWGSWQGGVWNLAFLGTLNPPSGTWPARPFTVIDKTPLVREKPFLTIDKTGAWSVFAPGPKKDSAGPGWTGSQESGATLPLATFHIAHPGTDTAATLNAALASGQNLLLTPGVYPLDESLKIARPGTVVLGLGMATLTPRRGTPAIDIADIDGVKIAGLILDAGETPSPYLLQVGPPGSARSHAADPVYLYDIFCRIGGAGAANAAAAVIINSNDVIGDHAWLWRADHGAGSGWTSSRANNGLIVNGANVTYYGLFVEHFQQYQTLWNGENGRLYFYQCEIPYDVPSTAAWTHDGIKGWAGYKVAANVKTHQAFALGIYSFFRDAPVVMDRAVEVPDAPGVRIQNAMTFWLNGAPGSSVQHVVNNLGAISDKTHREIRVLAYPPKP